MTVGAVGAISGLARIFGPAIRAGDLLLLVVKIGVIQLGLIAVVRIIFRDNTIISGNSHRIIGGQENIMFYRIMLFFYSSNYPITRTDRMTALGSIHPPMVVHFILTRITHNTPIHSRMTIIADNLALKKFPLIFAAREHLATILGMIAVLEPAVGLDYDWSFTK
jgi:hypothetical protein